MPFNDKLEFGKQYKMVDNHFELSKEYMDKEAWRFKKITATRLCSVLGKNEFTSPFKVWCQMVNIYYEEMDPMVSQVGVVVEKKVREFVNEYLKNKTGINFYYSFYEPKDVKWDCFKDIDEVFGGIPDGEPYIGSELVYDKGLPLLEIKTSSIDKFKYAKEKGVLKLQKNKDGSPMVKELGTKKLDWYNPNGSVKVPTEYLYQIGLYMYLRHISKGLIVCCFVDTKDYTNPDNVVVSSRNIAAKEITFNPIDMEKDLNKAREWFYKYVKGGISPEMTEKDRQWLKEAELIK